MTGPGALLLPIKEVKLLWTKLRARERRKSGTPRTPSGSDEIQLELNCSILSLLSWVGLTSMQVDALSGQKGLIHSDREIKGKCLQLIRELRARVAEQISTSQSITDGLRRILTPVQVAKFLMWVEKNQRSMDLLNTMLYSDAT